MFWIPHIISIFSPILTPAICLTGSGTSGAVLVLGTFVWNALECPTQDCIRLHQSCVGSSRDIYESEKDWIIYFWLPRFLKFVIFPRPVRVGPPKQFASQLIFHLDHWIGGGAVRSVQRLRNNSTNFIWQKRHRGDRRVPRNFIRHDLS